MVNTTLITGILRDAAGSVLPNTMVQFTRPGPAAQDGAVITSKTVSATSDTSGVISVNLYTGNYDAKIILSPYPEQFQLPVPAPTGSPIDWSGLVNGAPTVVTPDAVIDAQATAVDRIQTGQDVIEANAASASAQASATASANASVHTGSIKMNANAVVSDIIIPAGFNAASVGPLTIQPGITVTVSPDSVWAVL